MSKERTQSLPRRLHALVVCDEDDISIRLRDYLVRAGVETVATRRLANVWGQPAHQSIVLLPDDFDAGEVTDGLECLLSRRPSPFVIVITASPRLYGPLMESLGNPESVVIMPKPVWGWTIVDLLRQRQSGSA